MSFIAEVRSLIKINSSHWEEEEYEIAPGLKCKIIFECNNNLPGVVDRFLRRKASVGELRKTLRARDSLKYPDIASATSKADKPRGGGDIDVEGG